MRWKGPQPLKAWRSSYSPVSSEKQRTGRSAMAPFLGDVPEPRHVPGLMTGQEGCVVSVQHAQRYWIIETSLIWLRGTHFVGLKFLETHIGDIWSILSWVWNSFVVVVWHRYSVCIVLPGGLMMEHLSIFPSPLGCKSWRKNLTLPCFSVLIFHIGTQSVFVDDCSGFDRQPSTGRWHGERWIHIWLTINSKGIWHSEEDIRLGIVVLAWPSPGLVLSQSLPSPGPCVPCICRTWPPGDSLLWGLGLQACDSSSRCTIPSEKSRI